MTWDIAVDLASLVLLIAGAFLALVAGIGMLRFPDTLSRLHAATKPQVVGLLFVIVALALQARDVATLLMLAPLLFFQLLTSPIASHMVGRAAYRNGSIDRAATAIDDLAPAIDQAAREEGN